MMPYAHDLIRLIPERRYWEFGKVSFYLIHDIYNLAVGPAKIGLATKVEFEQIEEGSSLSPLRPSFSMAEAECQLLFDQLWNIGYRPSSHQNEASRVEAINAHLQDMRALVSKKLSVELPTSKERLR